jgi:7,8-dihydropterin-6-yl-methyl-4-(beta-D-ribofuranosyl)aminobenzene 5'-phosphate synthase
VKFSVLSDAKAVDGYGSEHGLSFLIEVDHKKFLFDTGASDLYLRNAEKLGLNMAELDAIVLSHGHFDHGNGLQYIKEKPLVCHPDCFVKRYRKSGKGYLGLALSEREIRKRFDLKTSREPVQLSEHLFFLGEVPRDNDFESQHTKYQLEDGSDDFIRDDSGLACISEGRLVVFSGCAHSGICNMVEHAQKSDGYQAGTCCHRRVSFETGQLANQKNHRLPERTPGETDLPLALYPGSCIKPDGGTFRRPCPHSRDSVCVLSPERSVTCMHGDS